MKSKSAWLCGCRTYSIHQGLSSGRGVAVQEPEQLEQRLLCTGYAGQGSVGLADVPSGCRQPAVDTAADSGTSCTAGYAAARSYAGW